jgi:hypothetical protein
MNTSILMNKSFDLSYTQQLGGIYITYLTLNFVGIVIGTLGNLIIITAIFSSKKLKKNPAYILMANLSLSDIGISIFVHIFTNIGNKKLSMKKTINSRLYFKYILNLILLKAFFMGKNSIRIEELFAHF